MIKIGKIINVLFIMAMIVGIFILGLTYADFEEFAVETYYDYFPQEIEGVNDGSFNPEFNFITKQCNNLSTVLDKSLCLRNQVRKFYVYNSTDDNWNLSFKEIVERGGDCKDWSMLYIQLAKSIGLNATYGRYDGIKDIHFGHRWAVVYNEVNYCKIDLMDVECHKRENTSNGGFSKPNDNNI